MSEVIIKKFRSCYLILTALNEAAVEATLTLMVVVPDKTTMLDTGVATYPFVFAPIALEEPSPAWYTVVPSQSL